MKIKRIMLVLIFCIVLNQPAYAAELEDTYISQYQRDLCIYYGIEYGICPEMLMALIEVESSGKQSAVMVLALVFVKLIPQSGANKRQKNFK